MGIMAWVVIDPTSDNKLKKAKGSTFAARKLKKQRKKNISCFKRSLNLGGIGDIYI